MTFSLKASCLCPDVDGSGDGGDGGGLCPGPGHVPGLQEAGSNRHAPGRSSSARTPPVDCAAASARTPNAL